MIFRSKFIHPKTIKPKYNPCLEWKNSVEKYGFKLFTHIDIIAEYCNRYEIIKVKTSQLLAEELA